MRRLNPLRPSLVLKKISTLGFCGISRTTTTRKRWFKVFSHILKKIDTPESFVVSFFTRKVSTFFYWRRLNHRSPEHNYDKTSNSWSCFRHYGILAKSRSRIATATSFPRQNDPGSITRVHYLINLKKVVLFII